VQNAEMQMQTGNKEHGTRNFKEDASTRRNEGLAITML
jgi:hypothetical protein